MSKIKAITFDLWDTIIIDDSDEPKRTKAGRLPKRHERRELVYKFLKKHDPVDPLMINIVYDTVDFAFNKVWKELNTTWTVEERLSLVLKGINFKLPDDDWKELIRLHEEMELEIRPDFVPGVREALEILKKSYKLGVISDTIFSPGRALRQMLADEGLLDFFDVLVFSDEAGKSKPDPGVFESALKELGVKPGELVHIGDREDKDVAGAMNIGARGILCRAAVEREVTKSRPAAVFDNYKDLPGIIEKLDI